MQVKAENAAKFAFISAPDAECERGRSPKLPRVDSRTLRSLCGLLIRSMLRSQINRRVSSRMRHSDFHQGGQPASQEKVCFQAVTLALYRRLPRRAGFNRFWSCQGGVGESNQINSAKILAGPNSQSIAPQGDRPIKNVGAQTRPTLVPGDDRADRVYLNRPYPIPANSARWACLRTCPNQCVQAGRIGCSLPLVRGREESGQSPESSLN